VRQLTRKHWNNREIPKKRFARNSDMKGRLTALVFSTLCLFLVACSKPADFTGFWKVSCRVWESERARWSLAKAYYSHRMESDIEICDVIVVVDQNAHVIVIRERRPINSQGQKTLSWQNRSLL
jgi:hypothetical protein